MRRLISAALLAAMAPVAVAVPTSGAVAQSPQDQQRWDAAQARFRQETDRYNAEQQRYMNARRTWRRDARYGNGYGKGGTYVPPYNGGNPGAGNNPEPISRRPVRVGVPPPGYAYPTGGTRVAPPSYRAPVMRSNPAPPAPRSAPAAPSVSRSH